MKKIIILSLLIILIGCKKISSTDKDNVYLCTFKITVKSNQNLQPIEGANVDIVIHKNILYDNDYDYDYEDGNYVLDTLITLCCDSSGEVYGNYPMNEKWDPYKIDIRVYVNGFESGLDGAIVKFQNPEVKKLFYLKPD